MTRGPLEIRREERQFQVFERPGFAVFDIVVSAGRHVRHVKVPAHEDEKYKVHVLHVRAYLMMKFNHRQNQFLETKRKTIISRAMCA